MVEARRPLLLAATLLLAALLATPMAYGLAPEQGEGGRPDTAPQPPGDGARGLEAPSVAGWIPVRGTRTATVQPAPAGDPPRRGPRVAFEPAVPGPATSTQAARWPEWPPRARRAEYFERWVIYVREGVFEGGGSITYVTRYGNFTFSAGEPAAPVRVTSPGALIGDPPLEAHVQYWLLVGGAPAELESSRIVERTAHRLAYEAVLGRGGSRFSMTVSWDFLNGGKTTVQVRRLAGDASFRVSLASTLPEAGELDPGVWLLRRPPADSLVPVPVRDRVAVRAQRTQYVVDWSDEADGAEPHAGALGPISGLVVLFRDGDAYIDPATWAEVFGPVTVDPGFNSTGEKTLLTMSTTLPAGGKNVIIAVFKQSTSDTNAQGIFRIEKGATILYATYLTQYVDADAMSAKPVMLLAVDPSPTGNDTYTFTIDITRAGKSTVSVHVQGAVVKTDDANWTYNSTAVSIAAGATATVVSLTTNYPANRKVVALAYVYASRASGTGHVFLGAGNIKVKLGGSVVSSNQFDQGSYQSSEPAQISLAWLGTLTSSTQTWSVEVTNGSSTAFTAYAVLVVFSVSDGAFLDTGSVALTANVQTTVGNLTTSLIGDVVVIALAAAFSSYTSDVTVFSVDGVVLQLNDSTTGQISNLVGWYFTTSSASSGKSGILPLLRFDTNVVNPSYQVKMTSAVSNIYGEAKIVAFVLAGHLVTIKYSVAAGGNAVQGQILMRYVFRGELRRLALSTSYQTVEVDRRSTIDVDFVSSGSTSSERWAYSGGGNFTATITSDSTFDLLYYNQLIAALIPVTALPRTEATGPANRAVVDARIFGATRTYHVWENGTTPTIWVDRGGNLAWRQTTTGSTATHRWATAGSITLENVQAPATSTATFYEQWLVTWQVQLAPGSTPLSPSNYAWARGTQFAGGLTLSPLVTSVTDWVDHHSLIWIETPTSGSNSTRRWISYYTPTYNVSASGTYYFPVQEEVLARILVLDADGANVVASAEEIVVRQYNGTVITLPLYSGLSPPVLLQANVDHAAARLVWRGLAIENGSADWSRFRATFRAVTANSTARLAFTRIWANLGGSGGEIWLRSQSLVTSVIWDRGRGVLYIQSEKSPGEVYVYYGFAGKTPRYLYIDGTLFSDVGYEVDTARQIIRLTVGGGSILLDFEGKTQPAPATDLQSMVQQLYAALSQLVIQQPRAPPITVPGIDLSFLLRLYGALAAAWDSRVAVLPSSIAFPGAFLLASFLLIYAALRRARRGAEPGRQYPREVVVVREPPYRAGFIRWAAASLASTAVLAPLLYYVLPRIYPRFFEQPAVDFRIFLFAVLAATAVALAFTAVILYGAGRPRRGVLKNRGGGR